MAWDANTKLVYNGIGTDGSKPNAETGQTATYVDNAEVDTAITNAYATNSGALMLDGTSDQVTFPDEDFYAFGTADFTLEFFVYFNNVPANAAFFEQGQGAPENFQTLSWNVYAGNRLQYTVSSAGNVTNHWGITWSFSSQSWYHVALSRSTGVDRMYINGTSQTTIGTTGGVVHNIPTVFRIGGAYTAVGPNGVNGYINGFRISNNCRYPANFTPPAAPFSSDSASVAIGMMTPNSGYWGAI